MAVAKTPVTCCNYVSANGDTAIVCLARPNELCSSTLTRGNHEFTLVSQSEAANCGECHPKKVKPGM